MGPESSQFPTGENSLLTPGEGHTDDAENFYPVTGPLGVCVEAKTQAGLAGAAGRGIPALSIIRERHLFWVAQATFTYCLNPLLFLLFLAFPSALKILPIFQNTPP